MKTPANQTAFPLSWPQGWPRVKFPRVGSFARYPMMWVSEEVIRQLRLLSASQIVISTNVELRLDGLPRSNQKEPADAGAAVYFSLKEKRCVLACDKWRTVDSNLWAIAKHIDAIRGQERWGVGSVEQAFSAYRALPPPGSSAGGSWWDILGCAPDCSLEIARAAWADRARASHPDRGGSHDSMSAINAAWDQARAHFAK